MRMLRQAMKSWARSPTLTWCQGRLLGGTALCPSPSSAPALHEGFSLTQLSSAEHSTSPLGETCLWLYWFDLGKWALWKILLSVRFLFPPMNSSRVWTEPTLMLTHFSPFSHCAEELLWKLHFDLHSDTVVLLNTTSSTIFVAKLEISTFLPNQSEILFA